MPRSKGRRLLSIKVKGGIILKEKYTPRVFALISDPCNAGALGISIHDPERLAGSSQEKGKEIWQNGLVHAKCE